MTDQKPNTIDQISTEEIVKDIRDTEYEIKTMTREIADLSMMNDRMSRFRADSRRSGIQERKDFINKLVKILKERGFIWCGFCGARPIDERGCPDCGPSLVGDCI